MRVRAARGDDFERVTALLELLGRPALTPEAHDDAKIIYEQQVVDPDCHHLVAEDPTGRIVAFCSLLFRRRLNYATYEAWIPDLFVLESARAAGVGRALLEEAERRAASHDCHALCVESEYRAAEAHHLYTQMRMRDSAKHFRKNIP